MVVNPTQPWDETVEIGFPQSTEHTGEYVWVKENVRQHI